MFKATVRYCSNRHLIWRKLNEKLEIDQKPITYLKLQIT